MYNIYYSITSMVVTISQTLEYPGKDVGLYVFGYIEHIDI